MRRVLWLHIIGFGFTVIYKTEHFKWLGTKTLLKELCFQVKRWLYSCSGFDPVKAHLSILHKLPCTFQNNATRAH